MKEILQNGSTVTGVKFAYTRQEGASLVETGEFFSLPADSILKAIGQNFVAADLGTDASIALALRQGRIATDEHGRTSNSKIWAGGDCRHGGRDLTVEAVEHGKQAALSIHAALAA